VAGRRLPTVHRHTQPSTITSPAITVRQLEHAAARLLPACPRPRRSAEPSRTPPSWRQPVQGKVGVKKQPRTLTIMPSSHATWSHSVGEAPAQRSNMPPPAPEHDLGMKHARGPLTHRRAPGSQTRCPASVSMRRRLRACQRSRTSDVPTPPIMRAIPASGAAPRPRSA
jgi:hypothetical protein